VERERILISLKGKPDDLFQGEGLNYPCLLVEMDRVLKISSQRIDLTSGKPVRTHLDSIAVSTPPGENRTQGISAQCLSSKETHISSKTGSSGSGLIII
jgi:hypothetical protein